MYNVSMYREDLKDISTTIAYTLKKERHLLSIHNIAKISNTFFDIAIK